MTGENYKADFVKLFSMMTFFYEGLIVIHQMKSLVCFLRLKLFDIVFFFHWHVLSTCFISFLDPSPMPSLSQDQILVWRELPPLYVTLSSTHDLIDHQKVKAITHQITSFRCPGLVEEPLVLKPPARTDQTLQLSEVGLRWTIKLNL